MPDWDDEHPEQAAGGEDAAPEEEELSAAAGEPPEGGEPEAFPEWELEDAQWSAAGGEGAPPEPSGGEAEAAGAEAAEEEAGGEEASGEDLLAALVAEIDAEVEATLREDADRGGAEEEAGEGDRYVVFDLDGSHYAVPIDNITEVGTVPEITPLPNVPPWLKGVTNLRGDILSVTDLRGFLGLEPAPQPEAGRLLVARSLADGMAAGLLVDRVAGMLSIPTGGVGEPAAPIEDRVAEYLAGVFRGEEHLIGVLDLERMLQAPEFREFEPA